METTDLTDAIDPVHAACHQALLRIRADFAEASRRVAAWQPREFPGGWYADRR
jgi:hypothetical protein